MGKTALITGIAGQDGTYLAEHLLALDYRVNGLYHSQRPESQERVAKIAPGVEFVKGDLTDSNSLISVMNKVKPDEIYNLGALSFVGSSWDEAEKYANVTGVGVLRILNATRQVVPEARVYQASSSEMFGQVRETPQRETTPFYPRSPYGIAKMTGHWYVVNFRESYGLYACSGILFNHESPRRGIEFVTRKITRAAARIRYGLQGELELGNLDSRRDWGFAGDYVQAMHLMLQQDRPDDYVVATGEAHTVREFAELAFEAAGLTIEWSVEPPKDSTDQRSVGERQIGVSRQDGRTLIKVSTKFFRPAEVDLLIGDSAKARQALGWQPSVSFPELVGMMTENDLREQRDQTRD